MSDSAPYAAAQEKHLPDRLSLMKRVQMPCGCIRAVDKISGLGVVEKKCSR